MTAVTVTVLGTDGGAERTYPAGADTVAAALGMCAQFGATFAVVAGRDGLTVVGADGVTYGPVPASAGAAWSDPENGTYHAPPARRRHLRLVSGVGS